MKTPSVYYIPEALFNKFKEDTLAHGTFSVNRPFMLEHFFIARPRVGSLFVFTNGSGGALKGTVSKIKKSSFVASSATFTQAKEKKSSVCLALSLLKNKKDEETVEICSELGVSSFVPLLCDRTVLRPDSGSFAKKENRWFSKALAGMEVSRRLFLPSVEETTGLSSYIENFGSPSGMGFYLSENAKTSFSSFLETLPSLNKPASYTLFIGPEGGFSDHEEALFLEKGFTPLFLSDSVMRAGTAGILASALLLEHLSTAQSAD